MQIFCPRWRWPRRSRRAEPGQDHPQHRGRVRGVSHTEVRKTKKKSPNKGLITYNMIINGPVWHWGGDEGSKDETLSHFPISPEDKRTLQTISEKLLLTQTETGLAFVCTNKSTIFAWNSFLLLTSNREVFVREYLVFYSLSPETQCNLYTYYSLLYYAVFSQYSPSQPKERPS